MKNVIIYSGFLSIILLASCSKNVLNETPEAFLSPNNSYLTLAGFQTAIIGLYPYLRNENDWEDGLVCYNMALGTDIATYGSTAPSSSMLIAYDQVNATNPISAQYWSWGFQLIQQANVIITRANNPAVQWTTAQQNAVVAEARWVRAYTYNVLVNLFNGVPINDQEITGVKLDFVRSSRDSVLNFIQSDLLFASQNLPDMPPAPGRVSKAAAYHLLAEVDIDLQKYDSAVIAASWVINNPSYGLMTQRFGSDASLPGDVYSDLFKDGNYDIAANKETIWSLQFAYGAPGTSGSGSATGNDNLRAWGPQYWQLPGFALPPDGADSLGRGVGWVVPTPYLANTIWNAPGETTDIRNSPYNIRRTWYYNKIGSPLYGKQYTGSTDSSFYIYPMFRKIEGILYDSTTGRTYTDVYRMRVAETYLLRAEAYMDEGDLTDAAADINTVRARSNASPITPAQVNINYILDERARELSIEETRRRTLARLGLLYQAVVANGPIPSQTTVQPFNNWLPVPQSAIDANSGAILTQNPGY
jgi:hypothetical protein